MSSHLSEKIAEFVFDELSAPETAEAERHLAQCSDCRQQVEQFQTTHAMLRTSTDVELPRRIMFEFEKPRVTSWVWRWLAPMAASAAVAFAVVNLTPHQQVQPQVVERVVEKQVVAQSQPSAAEPVDYQKIQAWLTTELNKRDGIQAKELMRVRGDLALLDSYQRAVEKETWNNASSIQLLASKD
jgi:anti-sigma factor RsiW